MANVDWYIEGLEFGNCNCDYGCPCQFEALPTQGNCRGFEVLRIDRGHFGEVKLDGLKVAVLYAWPGPIFEGNGALQAIVDERADAGQRDALTKVLHGEETDEAATPWWVYRAVSTTLHETLFKPIEFEIDLEARTARVAIPGSWNPPGGRSARRMAATRTGCGSTFQTASSSSWPRSAAPRPRRPGG